MSTMRRTYSGWSWNLLRRGRGGAGLATRVGIGRFIDRLSLESVREPYRAHVLNVMWAITFAAYQVMSGKRTVPHLITIVP
jgi:hypothetical protein